MASALSSSHQPLPLSPEGELKHGDLLYGEMSNTAVRVREIGNKFHIVQVLKAVDDDEPDDSCLEVGEPITNKQGEKFVVISYSNNFGIIRKEIGFPNREMKSDLTHGQIGKFILARSISGQSNSSSSSSQVDGRLQNPKKLESFLANLGEKEKKEKKDAFNLKLISQGDLSHGGKGIELTLGAKLGLEASMSELTLDEPVKTPELKKANSMEVALYDKFYTHPEVAKMCVDEFKKYITIDDEDLLIEPSAGNGAFSDCFAKTYEEDLIYDEDDLDFGYEGENKIMAFDIAPEKEGIIKKDFFSVDLSKRGRADLHFIGNPPFGSNSEIAISFITMILNAEKSKSISFILPANFNSEKMQTRVFYKNFRKWKLLFSKTIKEMMENVSGTFRFRKLPRLKPFLKKGKPHDVKCVFQIWEKQETNVEPPVSPEKKYFDEHGGKAKHFTIVKDKKNAHYAVGNQAQTGKLLSPDHKFARESGSGRFIKLKNPQYVSLLADDLGKKIVGKDDNYHSVRYIPLQELNYAVDKLIETKLKKQIDDLPAMREIQSNADEVSEVTLIPGKINGHYHCYNEKTKFLYKIETDEDPNEKFKEGENIDDVLVKVGVWNEATKKAHFFDDDEGGNDEGGI